jgi:hypothetical protein
MPTRILGSLVHTKKASGVPSGGLGRSYAAGYRFFRFTAFFFAFFFAAFFAAFFFAGFFFAAFLAAFFFAGVFTAGFAAGFAGGGAPTEVVSTPQQ